MLCPVGLIARFTAQLDVADAAGVIDVPVELGALPPTPPYAVQAGETWSFRLWHTFQ